MLSLLFVFVLGITQTSAEVDHRDEQKPKVELSEDNLEQPAIQLAYDLNYDEVCNVDSAKHEKIADYQSALSKSSDTKNRLDKLFKQADKAFTSKFNKHYGKLKVKKILRYSIKEYKDNLIRSPAK